MNKKYFQYKYCNGALLLEVPKYTVRDGENKPMVYKVEKGKKYDLSYGSNFIEHEFNEVYVFSENFMECLIQGLRILERWKKDFLEIFSKNNFYFLVSFDEDGQGASINLRFEVDRGDKTFAKECIKMILPKPSIKGNYSFAGDMSEIITNLPKGKMSKMPEEIKEIVNFLNIKFLSS